MAMLYYVAILVGLHFSISLPGFPERMFRDQIDQHLTSAITGICGLGGLGKFDPYTV